MEIDLGRDLLQMLSNDQRMMLEIEDIILNDNSYQKRNIITKMVSLNPPNSRFLTYLVDWQWI
jgi:hypothetical protein